MSNLGSGTLELDGLRFTGSNDWPDGARTGAVVAEPVRLACGVQDGIARAAFGFDLFAVNFPTDDQAAFEDQEDVFDVVAYGLMPIP